MANIDNGFTVDILSIKDEVLVTTGTSDPSSAGYEAPEGSLYIRKDGVNTLLYLKSDINDTNWNKVVSPGVLTAKQVLASPVGSSGIPSFRQLQLPDLSDVNLGSPQSGDVLFYDGNYWVPQATNILDVVVSIYNGNIPATSGTTTIPLDNTVPLVTEGTQLWTRTVTPTFNTTKFSMRMSCMVGAANSSRTIILSFFRGTTCLYAAAAGIQTRDAPSIVSFNHTDNPNTTSPVTYSVRIGLTSSGSSWYINRTWNSTLGGQTSTYELQEIAPT